jgi:acyl-CoA hydrolase
MHGSEGTKRGSNQENNTDFAARDHGVWVKSSMTRRAKVWLKDHANRQTQQRCAAVFHVVAVDSAA